MLRAFRISLLGLDCAALLGAGPVPGPAPLPTPLPTSYLVPGCSAALPLDAGQAFAGPRFLIQGDRIDFFAAAPPGPGVPPESRWRRQGGERLPATPPAAGMQRARVKWRDGALWMKAGRRIYQQDPATRQWFLMADPGLEFRDFEVDLKGRTLLIATADPRTRRYRALVEAVQADRRSTEVLFEYPDRDFAGWFGRVAPVAAATLLTGYESVQIQEYIVLFNPLARRAFIFQAIDGTLKEAALGLPTRGVDQVAAAMAGEPAHSESSDLTGERFGDLCWQVLPRSPSEAWVIYPGGADPAAPQEAGATAPVMAIALDLAEGRCGPPTPLEGVRLPVFFDPRGRLTGLAEALERFARQAKN